MKTPFTAEQFLQVFKEYNLAVFPMQIAFYLVGIAAVYFAVKPFARSDQFISIILSFFWLWMGIVYHLIFFSAINKAALAFGLIFILQGILFLVFGLIQNRLSFQFHTGGFGITGMILILFALIGYPLFGYFNGHVYPSSPTFGLPCPTTIFTFGLLLMSAKKCPVAILIIPFLWSIAGFTATFQFGIIEDTGLLVAGLVSFTMLLVKNRMQSKLKIQKIQG